ncbi:MAG: LytR/AlgR family response regulator transcription factor [Gemmatimonadota bacterium]
MIADDELLARQRLIRLLEAEGDAEIVAVCADGRQAVDAIRQQAPDVVFLDIQMPELDAFGVLTEVGPERAPRVVFVTAYDSYALQAFEIQAVDYLLKPVDAMRFRHTFQRLRQQVVSERSREATRHLLFVLGSLAAERPSERIAIKEDGRIHFVRVGDIDWVEAASNYVRLHVGKEVHLLRETMARLEARLDCQRFVRVHRGTIVNLERVKEVQPWFSGDYVMILIDGTRVRIGRNYREKVGEVLGSPF